MWKNPLLKNASWHFPDNIASVPHISFFIVYKRKELSCCNIISCEAGSHIHLYTYIYKINLSFHECLKSVNCLSPHQLNLF